MSRVVDIIPLLERPLHTQQDGFTHNFSNSKIPCAIPLNNSLFSIHIGIEIQHTLKYCKKPIYGQSQKRAWVHYLISSRNI